VNNLAERVKLDTLKEALHAIFDHYGPILDIVAKTSLRRKGQAFIVFDSQKSALQAVEEMSGFELYGKQMKVSMAKTHSDETLKRKATEEQFEQHKRERLTLKGMSPSDTRIFAINDANSGYREETRRAG
jgi:RNA recognition motif-containing protein